MVFFAPPGGGTTGAWQAGTHLGTARGGEPGALTWAELLTPEPQSAVGFFQQLFGHDVTEYPQDDGGKYTTLMVDGAEVAGIAAVPADAEGTLKPGWQVYFGVSSVAEAVAAAVGRRRHGPDRTGRGRGSRHHRHPRGPAGRRVQRAGGLGRGLNTSSAPQLPVGRSTRWRLTRG